MNEIEITSVKLAGQGFLLNGDMFVPEAPGNRHYQAVQAWLDAGNTPEPADPEPVPGPSREDDMLAVLLAAVPSLPAQASQAAKDALARLKGG